MRCYGVGKVCVWVAADCARWLVIGVGKCKERVPYARLPQLLLGPLEDVAVAV